MKKPKLSPFILLFLFVFITSSAQAQGWFNEKIKGNGEVTTEDRSVKNFENISVSGGLEVIYTQGPKSVTVEADSNLLQYILTEVSSNQLVVKRKNNVSFRNYSSAIIYVSSPDIYALKASSGSSLTANGQISTSKMKLNSSSGAGLTADITSKTIDISCSSGANVVVNVKAETLEASSSSGSSISIEGTSNNADLSASSAGTIKGKSLSVIDCDASASSGGGISITVSEGLDASASSGASIKYFGTPNTVDRSVSSGGSVNNK